LLQFGAGVEKYSNCILIAKLPAKGCVGKEPILLSCYADTVKPGVGIEPFLQDGVISLLPIWEIIIIIVELLRLSAE